jgi:DNA repair protein RadC
LSAPPRWSEKASLYQGTVNSSVLRTAEVFRPAVIRTCPDLILCHNHPSGDPAPQPEDISATRQLVEAARIFE